MSPRNRVLTALIATGTLSVAFAAPAAAAKASYDDPADAQASLTDIRHVKLNHSQDRLVVKVRFTDLRRHSTAGPAGLTIFVDTRGARRGPEYQLSTGLQAGTDFQLVPSRRRQPVDDPVDCDHDLKLRFAEDRLVFHADRDCFETPERLRIGVKMIDEWDGSHPVRDWLGEPRSWTDWLAAG